MKTTWGRILWLVAAAALAAGCTESQRPTATGKGTIRGVHAMVSAPNVSFLIEERSLETLSYRATSSAQAFDDLTYNFNFDVRLPGSSAPRRLATETLTVVPDTDYVFALTGTLEHPSIVLWETPERMWNGDETVLEVAAGHLAQSTGVVDVYLAPPGTAPATGEALGTLAFGDKLEPLEIEKGDYVLTITEGGHPANVLFRSGTQSLTERTSLMFTLQDPDPSLTSALSVQRVTREGAATRLVDSRFPATRRFFHAAQGTANVDVIVDGDFTNPAVPGLTYGTLSADVPVPSGETKFAFTQAGNSGAILFEDEEAVSGNTRSTTFLAGEPGDLAMVTLTDDRRPVTDVAKLRMTFLSQSIEEADFWLLKAGTDIADSAPNFPNFDAQTSSGYLTLAADKYELTVTFGDDDTVAVGPVPVNLVAGDIVELAVIDTADPNVLDVVTYDP